ncbi:hypothetical protein [Mycolicibacterium peregrinum]|uniref:Uncharacterized protein n=1 Tax=Mycolicibacterium peregrinum TaxID=43304 RepID=A0A1A0WFK9_MYCPR|nr:hypothetical protein [Mycolicibacterium peregrinum]OBB97177.1 hypothetical protein A5779_15590 [Mycolicibacterium peregrinum]
MGKDKPQLETLTDQMKGWQASGDADLKISPAGRDKYVTAIGNLRGELVLAKGQIAKLKEIGDVGKYPAATDTKSGLVEDATTLETMLNDYIAYLDAYKQTVIDSCNRMMQSG